MKQLLFPCGSCQEPKPVYRSGRYAGLIRRHWHPYVEGLRRCPGGRQPVGGDAL